MIIKFNSISILNDKVVYLLNGIYGLTELKVTCNEFNKTFYRNESDYTIRVEIPIENYKDKVEFSYNDEILLTIYIKDNIKPHEKLNFINIDVEDLYSKEPLSINIFKLNANIYMKQINNTSEIPKINIIKFNEITKLPGNTGDYETGFNNGFVIGQLL